MPSIIKVDQIQSDLGTVNVSSNLQFSSGFTMRSPTIATPTFTGQATIPTINLTGGQIAFPASQSSSSDPNTLDDYEEGSFTPTVTAASGANGGLTTTGRYTKIGRFVYVTMVITGISKGTLSGQLAVGNLPFNVADTNTTGTMRYDLAGTPASGTTIICPQSGGGTGLELQMFSGSGYLGNLAASNVGSTFQFYNITYIYNTNT